MKGIYKPKSSRFYWIRYAGIDGNTVRESSKSERFKDAQALLLKRKQAISEGKLPEVVRIKKTYLFKELADEYLRFAERQRSIRSKEGFIRQLLSHFGTIPLRRFNTLMLEQYQTERLNKGNKPATVNRHLATLKHMFTKAVDWHMVEEEVLKRVRKAKLIPENNRRLRFLSQDEIRALITFCDAHVRPIVITALNTGMRKTEILSLKWEQVDMKHGFILVDTTKNGERKEIPINSTLRQALTGLTRRLDVPYLFFDPKTGKRYQDVKRSFQTACRKAGIHDFKFHDLRHTFASHLVMAGVDLTTVKELLGHKDIKMTLRYSHLAPAHRVKALDILDERLNGQSTAHLLHILASGGNIRQAKSLKKMEPGIGLEPTTC